MSHTPGPWGTYLNEETNQFEIFHDEGRGFGRMLARIVGERGRFQANARLIAAAPDLLAACEVLADAYNNHDWSDSGVSNDLYNAMEQLRAAVAKARGE